MQQKLLQSSTTGTTIIRTPLQQKTPIFYNRNSCSPYNLKTETSPILTASFQKQLQSLPFQSNFKYLLKGRAATPPSVSEGTAQSGVRDGCQSLEDHGFLSKKNIIALASSSSSSSRWQREDEQPVTCSISSCSPHSTALLINPKTGAIPLPSLVELPTSSSGAERLPSQLSRSLFILAVSRAVPGCTATYMETVVYITLHRRWSTVEDVRGSVERHGGLKP